MLFCAHRLLFLQENAIFTQITSLYVPFSISNIIFGHHFSSFLNYFVWLRITDEGSVPEMRTWSILLIKSYLKWCIHLSWSLFSYYHTFVLMGDLSLTSISRISAQCKRSRGWWILEKPVLKPGLPTPDKNSFTHVTFFYGMNGSERIKSLNLPGCGITGWLVVGWLWFYVTFSDISAI